MTAFTVQDLMIDALAGGAPGKRLTIDLSLHDVLRRIVLSPHSLRADDIVVFEQGADGRLQYVEAPPVRTYRGWVEGADDDSMAAVSLTPSGGIAGIVRLGDETWGIQPLADVQPGAAPSLHVVYRQADLVQSSLRCGVVDPIDPAERARRAHGRRDDGGGEDGGIAGSGLTGGFRADIAFDADFEYYLLNGSSTANTIADIEMVMNVTDANYHADLGIDFRITAIIVRTSEPDPYAAFDGIPLLTEFRTHWNANHGSIVRDFAHLMTGKSVTDALGYAYLGTACIYHDFAYGFSRSRFYVNLIERARITTHEIGHNLNANHCDGASDCGIMCTHGCSGNHTGFDSVSAAAIQAWLNSTTCMAPMGACCVGTSCTQVSAAECGAIGGIWTPGAPCEIRHVYSATPNLAIPDGAPAGVTHTISVADSFTISDLNVRINIPHTWVGDLVVELSHNGGPFVRLVDRMGVPASTFGCSGDNLRVVLDSQGTGGPIESLCSTPNVPTSGPAFTPANPLTAFNGQNASGTWTLRVIDQATPDPGTLASWSLSMREAVPSFCVPQGACCIDSTCTQAGQVACAASGGTWTAGAACYQSSTFSAAVNAPIPDASPVGVSSTINIAENFDVGDLNLRLTLAHTWVGDLVVTLSHNGGPAVTLIDRPGLPATAFGCHNDNYNIVLDDEGQGGPIEALCDHNATSPPNYLPNNPLSAFDGQNISGSWTLTVYDMASEDVGTLLSWGLTAQDAGSNLCAEPCAADVAPPGGNGQVDVDDLIAVILGWGACAPPCPPSCAADIVPNCAVDVDDLIAVILGWGPCP